MKNTNMHRKGSMDSISTPDANKIRKLNDSSFRGNKINQKAESIFEGEKFRKRGKFDVAVKNYSDEALAKKKQEEEQKKQEEIEKFEDFEDSFIKKQKEELKGREGRLSKGAKRRIIIACAAFAVLIGFLFFVPPFILDSEEGEGVMYEENIFSSMGMTELKAYAVTNYSVWNEDAFSSEKNENYRLVKLKLYAHNASPFEIEIPNIRISSVDSAYKDKICYVRVVNKDDTSKTYISAFSESIIDIEILVNVADLTDEQFSKAVNGIVLSTDGMCKKLGNISIPCIPAYTWVSDNLMLEVNKKN